MIQPPTFPNALASSGLSPLTASIKISALANNLSEIRRCISPSCDILAVVKANAYGHGATMIAKSLVDLGVQRLGVATVQEGCTLRQHGITQPILVMGGLLPNQLQELIQHRLTPVLSNDEITHLLAELIDQNLSPYPVHVKVDTGMRRLGFNADSVLSFLDTKPFQHLLHVEGVMTHLADADNLDSTFTQSQLKQFQSLISQIKLTGHSIAMFHAANSAGIMYHPTSHFNMVRPGLMLYGCATRKTPHVDIALQPAMKISSHVVQVRAVAEGEVLGYGCSYRTTRPSKIATLPVGYAHGYSRSLSNRGIVLVQGQRVPVVGRVCMDMTLVDVTDLPQVVLGEEVVLLGRQEEEEITAEEISECLGTIPYEVLCNMGTRAHHVYEPL